MGQSRQRRLCFSVATAREHVAKQHRRVLTEQANFGSVSQVFMKYCRFGDRRNEGRMVEAKLTALCKDAGITDAKRFPAPRVGISFAKVKSKVRKAKGFAFGSVFLGLSWRVLTCLGLSSIRFSWFPLPRAFLRLALACLCLSLLVFALI